MNSVLSVKLQLKPTNLKITLVCGNHRERCGRPEGRLRTSAPAVEDTDEYRKVGSREKREGTKSQWRFLTPAWSSMSTRHVSLLTGISRESSTPRLHSSIYLVVGTEVPLCRETPGVDGGLHWSSCSLGQTEKQEWTNPWSTS